MSMRSLSVWLCLSAIGLGACSTSSTSSTTSTTVETTVEGDSLWAPCGDIECAQVQVPVDYSNPDGALMNLAVFRRVSTSATPDFPVVLVPDYLYGDDARALIEFAPAHLGSKWTAQTLISVSRRGSQLSPMPVGSEHFVSTRDVARDLDYVRTFLDLDAMRAMGWGTGATALAVLALENPTALSHMVLDSPSHPLLAAQERVSAQITSDNANVAEALRWCVSHISCSMNANVAKSFNLFRTNTRIGIVDKAVTSVVLGRAARTAFALADPQAFFTGVSQATIGNSASLFAVAGEGASSEVIHVLCADETPMGAQLMAKQLATNHEDVSRFFSLGDDHVMYEQCGQLSESVRPLESVEVATQLPKVNTLVIAAENNPVTPFALSSALAQKFSWELSALPLWRHLMVGHDDPTTQRAIEFLTR